MAYIRVWPFMLACFMLFGITWHILAQSVSALEFPALRLKLASLQLELPLSLVVPVRSQHLQAGNDN